MKFKGGYRVVNLELGQCQQDENQAFLFDISTWRMILIMEEGKLEKQNVMRKSQPVTMNVPDVDKNEIEERAEEVCRYVFLQ